LGRGFTLAITASTAAFSATTALIGSVTTCRCCGPCRASPRVFRVCRSKRRRIRIGAALSVSAAASISAALSSSPTAKSASAAISVTILLLSIDVNIQRTTFQFGAVSLEDGLHKAVPVRESDMSPAAWATRFVGHAEDDISDVTTTIDKIFPKILRGGFVA
jgi:hypothetical protein